VFSVQVAYTLKINVFFQLNRYIVRSQMVSMFKGLLSCNAPTIFVLHFLLKVVIAIHGDQSRLDAEHNAEPLSNQQHSVAVDLSPLYNNRGFGKVAGEANFDGRGSVLTISRVAQWI
jgi:hypothetical protein